MHQLVPHFILERYRARQFSGSSQAAGLYVDLSGFSKMADILSGYEQAGAEVLTDVMRTIFEPLVAAVYSQGGFVLGYSGDAFMAIFIEHLDLEPAMLRCLEAAMRMQIHVKENPQAVTRFGQFPLSIKVGIGYGEASWNILQTSNGKRATYYFYGSSVIGAVASEKCAQPGEIVADGPAYEHLHGIIAGQPRDGCFVLSDLHAGLPAPHSVPDPEPDPEDMHLFVPDSIIALATVGEFRQVVNLFIDIPLDPADNQSVPPFMDTVFDLQEHYGGFFLRPEFSDKGFTLLMFWGAPVAYETDVVRALKFALGLKVRSGLPIRAGIAYLTAFAGFMGVPLREDYTAYGWGVNLAARFMHMASPGEIWVDEGVARRAEKLYDIHYRDALAVKGFAGKQNVFILEGPKESSEASYHGELVGRAREIEQISAFIEPIDTGRFAGMLLIQGEAGIGKSRLVNSLQVVDALSQSRRHWAVCQTDEILRQSLNPYKGWLMKRFDVTDSEPEKASLENFHARLRTLIETTPIPHLAVELERTSSVLAALLGLSQPGSLYEQLDAKERYENTFIALSTLLRAESLQKPLVLFIEDIQWLDDDSRAFFPYFVRTILAEPDIDYPIAILATRRPEGDSLHFGVMPYAQVLNLERLPASELSQLAEHVLGGRVSASLLNLLERRTDGNPFFAEQILRYLSDKDLLVKSENGFFDADLRAERSLPLDVSAILIARLDSLAQEVRDIVQTASVLGREFEVQLLTGILRGVTDMPQKINQAVQAEIWFPLDQIRYIFRHALLRDAAYSMQLQTRQRRLHELAVSAMEKLYADDLSLHYGELAYHAEHANLVEKALIYLPLAGQAAASAYQNKQAVDYYSRALALASPKNMRARFDHLMTRARLYGLMGERNLQFQDLETLEQVAQQLGEDALLAQVWMMRADYAYSISEYQFAIEKARQAVDLAQATGIEAVALDGYRVMPLALLRQGKLDEAMWQAQEGLQLVRRLGQRIEEGKILNSMGLIALEQKVPANAQSYFEQALQIARETNNRGLETKSLNNLGNSAGFILGDYAAARMYYEQAYLIARERGDRSLHGVALANLGWAAGMQGDFVSARSYHEQALSLSREVGDLYHEAYTLINLSAVAVSQEEGQTAIVFARRANELSQKIGERSGQAWSLLYLGYASLLENDFAMARNYFQESVAIREELGQKGLAMEPAAGLVQVALKMDDLSSASRETENILLHLENGDTLEGTEEPLRIYLACYQALQKLKDPRSISVLREAAKLLEAQVSKLRDADARRAFIQNVPCRRAIDQAWQDLERDSR